MSSEDNTPRSSPPPPRPQHRSVPNTPPNGMTATPPDSYPDETGRHMAVEILGRQETPVERATRIAEEARRGVKNLWDNGVGKPPQPHIGFPGSGLWKTVAETNDIARATHAVVVGAQGVKEKWSVRAGAAAWEAFKYLLIATLAALITWMSGLRTPMPPPQQAPAAQGK